MHNFPNKNRQINKMSTFKGKMEQYTNISVDSFIGDNLTSTVYFLSHRHEGLIMLYNNPF